MAIADILVHVDQTPAYRARLDLALRLGRRFHARVTGVFLLPLLDALALPDSGAGAATLATYIAEQKAAADEIGRNFLAMLGKYQVEAIWHVEVAPAAASFMRHACGTDLVILGQYDPDHPSELAAPENVILACGRPVLVVPHQGNVGDIGARPLIAWNGRREASRAMQEALPLLGEAVVVSLARAEPTDPDDKDIAMEAMRHLERHGLKPSFVPKIPNANNVAGEILSRADEMRADLIVMGAYGHSRLRESVLGGTTSAMLRQMTRPVLMTH